MVVITLCKPGIGSSVRSAAAPPMFPADPEVTRDSPTDPEVTWAAPVDPPAAGGGAAIALATKAPPVCGRAVFAAPPESVESDSVAGEPLLPAVLGAAKGSTAISLASV